MSASLDDVNKMLSQVYKDRLVEQLSDHEKVCELMKRFERKSHWVEGDEVDREAFDNWKSKIEPLIEQGRAEGWLNAYEDYDGSVEFDYVSPARKRVQVFDETVAEWRERQRRMLNADGTITFKVVRREDV